MGFAARIMQKTRSIRQLLNFPRVMLFLHRARYDRYEMKQSDYQMMAGSTIEEFPGRIRKKCRVPRSGFNPYGGKLIGTGKKSPTPPPHFRAGVNEARLSGQSDQFCRAARHTYS